MDGGKKHTMGGSNGVRYEMDGRINGIREWDESRTGEWRSERWERWSVPPPPLSCLLGVIVQGGRVMRGHVRTLWYGGPQRSIHWDLREQIEFSTCLCQCVIFVCVCCQLIVRFACVSSICICLLQCCQGHCILSILMTIKRHTFVLLA